MNILHNRELVIMDMIPTDISIELDNGNKCIMIEADTIIPISNTKKFMVNKLDLNFNIYQNNTIIHNISYKLKDFNNNIISITCKVNNNSNITIILTDNYNIMNYYKCYTNKNINSNNFDMKQYYINDNKSKLLHIMNNKLKLLNSTNNIMLINETKNIINNINNIDNINELIEKNKYYDIINIHNINIKQNINNNHITTINNIINNILMQNNICQRMKKFIVKAQNIIDIVNINNNELENIIKEYNYIIST